MNATINEGFKLTDARFGQMSSLVNDAAQHAAKNLEAAKDSFVGGLQGVEQARAQLVETSVKALEQQVATASAFAKVKSPQEAFELQQQFVRQSLELYKANTSALTTALTSAFNAALKPLNERYTDVSKSVSKS